MTRFGSAVRRLDIRAPGSNLPLLSVSQTLGVVRRSELTDKPPRAETLDVYKTCERGDIVFNKMSIRSGAMGVAREGGLVTYHYEVLRPRAGHDARYLAYLMKSHYFTSEMIKRERGIGAGDQVGVRTTEVPFTSLSTIDVHLPGPEEQVAIADFLDRETAKIDALIATEQGLRAATIAREDALIESSVLGRDRSESRAAEPWLRKVQKGWEVTRLGYHFEVVLGKMLDEGKQAPEGSEVLDYLRAANIRATHLDLDDVNQMAFTRHERSRLSLMSGDLLVVEGGMVGRSHLLREDLPTMSFQKTLNRVRFRGAGSTHYLHYALRWLKAAGVIDLMCDGSTFMHLTAEKLRALSIPWPPVAEQSEIAQDLDEALADSQNLIGKIDEAIALAQERRAALITAAATGQLDIGGEA